jgi:hypothetical protein
MKRLIGFAAALSLAAGLTQAMTVQNIASPLPAGGFAGFDAEALVGIVPEAGPAGVNLRVAGRRGGAGRGGAGPARQPGGYNQGAQRQQQRDVNRDVDVDIDDGRDHIIEDDAARGAVVGIGIGAAIANSDDPDVTCPDENADGVCDDNPG